MAIIEREAQAATDPHLHQVERASDIGRDQNPSSLPNLGSGPQKPHFSDDSVLDKDLLFRHWDQTRNQVLANYRNESEVLEAEHQKLLANLASVLERKRTAESEHERIMRKIDREFNDPAKRKLILQRIKEGSTNRPVISGTLTKAERKRRWLGERDAGQESKHQKA